MDEMRLLYVLPLVTLLLSSCIVQTHRHFYNMGRSGSYLEDKDCQFLQVNDTLYVEGKLYRYKYHVPHLYVFLEPSNYPYPVEVKNDTPCTVYGEIVTEKDKHGITYWERNDTPWLTKKPEGAKPIKLKRAYHRGANMTLYYGPLHSHNRIVAEPEPAHATIHALYAYPLAALSLIAVDIPVTVVANTLFLGGGLLSAPYFMLTDDHQQQEPRQ